MSITAAQPLSQLCLLETILPEPMLETVELSLEVFGLKKKQQLLKKTKQNFKLNL